MKSGAGNVGDHSWTHRIREMAEGERLSPEEEYQAMYRAQRMAVRRNRIAALRLVLAFSVVVAAAIVWYMSIPVEPGLYPGKVIGGTYYSAEDGFRFPVMWVKAHPFQRQPPAISRFVLQDEHGQTVASAQRGSVTVAFDKERSPLARWVQGWITVQPTTGDQATVCSAVIQLGGSGERVFDIGVLHLLGKEESPVAGSPAFSARMLYPEAAALSFTSVEIGASATQQSAEITGVTIGGLSGLIPTGVQVLQLGTPGPAPVIALPPGTPTITRVDVTQLPPLTGVTFIRVTELPSGLILEDVMRFVGWQVCRLPVEIPVGETSRIAVELVPWATVLADEFFLYIPVEVAYRAAGEDGVARLTAHDVRWGRPPGLFQTKTAVRRASMPALP